MRRFWVVLFSLLMLLVAPTISAESWFDDSTSPKVKANPEIDSDTPEDMVTVPAGEFTMGSNSDVKNEKPVRQVYLDAYAIDRTEVTVAAYKQCVDGGDCTTPDTMGEYCSGKYSKYNNWTNNRSDHPVNCVDWNQAKVYCEWAGSRLPTEAEWEKAARGTDARKYPWGNGEATCQNAVVKEGGEGCGRDSTWPVGSKASGASVYGALDMAGNVWEWTADWKGPYDASQTDNPRGPSTGSERVVRGGSFNLTANLVRAAYRLSFTPSSANYVLGFRCARSL